MKIAYIVPSLLQRGPIVVVNSLIRYLFDKVEKIDLYYFDEVPNAMSFDCNIFKIKMDEPIDFDSYDIIHSHCFRADRYLARWKSHIKSAKTISTLHQDTFMSFSFQYGKLISYLLTSYWCRIQSRFDLVVSISNQLKDFYVNKITTKLVTVYNGCSIDINSDATQDSIKGKINQLRDDGLIVLGTYAYVTKRKGLSQILDALRFLDSFALVVIGDGPYVEALKKQVEKYHLSNRVLFFAHQKFPYNYLQYFDIYVMPSYSEGFGLAMVEAALAKKAIVCSNLPSFYEIFPNDEASFFELHNIESLKSAIIKAHIEKGKFEKRAYERSCQYFTSEKMAENYLSVYQKLIE